MAVEPSAVLVDFRHGLGGEVDVHGVRADGTRGGVEYAIELDDDTVEVKLVPGVAVKLVAALASEPAPEETPGEWRVASDEEKWATSMDRLGTPPSPGRIY
jgi:hypothetical protein